MKVSTPAKPRRVVCFGDSVTGPHPDQSQTYQENYLKYSDILQGLLSAAYPTDYWEVVNRGWAGSKASGGIDHPDAATRSQSEILPLHADVVTVLIGGNDMSPTSPGTHGTCGEALMKLGETLKNVPLVCVMLYPPPVTRPDQEANAWHHLVHANPFLTRMAERYGFPILDLGPPLLEASRRHGHGLVADPVDGVHLKPMGEMAVALSILRFLSIQSVPFALEGAARGRCSA
jgi:lysophospholipase L1-like esterase